MVSAGSIGPSPDSIMAPSPDPPLELEVCGANEIVPLAFVVGHNDVPFCEDSSDVISLDEMPSEAFVL